LSQGPFAGRFADAHDLSELRYILWRRDGKRAAAERVGLPGAMPPLPLRVESGALRRRQAHSCSGRSGTGPAGDGGGTGSRWRRYMVPPLQGAPRLAFDRIAAGLAGVRTVQVGLPDASGYAAARVAWRSAMSSLFARYEAGRARNGWRLSLSRAQLLIVALLVADATIIGLRAQVTWLMPQTGLPVDLYALRFDNVAAVAERRDAKTVLVVNGKISNSRTRTETVPRLRFAVRDAGHQEIFSWSAAPARDNLGARETIQFRSELALPPPDTRDVVVRFDHDDGL